MNKALLDTDIYSEVLKSVDPIVAANAASYRQQHGIYTVSVITLMEIVHSFQKTQSTRRLQTFLAAVALEDVLPFDESAAKLSGRISGDLDRVGRPIGRCDPMIAAIAITHGLELVTGNTIHYQRVQSLVYPVTLANWR